MSWETILVALIAVLGTLGAQWISERRQRRRDERDQTRWGAERRDRKSETRREELKLALAEFARCCEKVKIAAIWDPVQGRTEGRL